MNHVLTRLLVARLLQIVALSSIFVGLITHRLLADLTLVSTVNVIGMPLDPGHSDNFQFPLTITTFFQGEKARMEVSDGRVYIFDNEKDTVYQLDTKFDTFRTGSIKNLLDFKSSVPKEQQTNISVSSDLSTGDPLDSDTFLTLETKSISLAGDAHISISGSSGGRRGGGGGGLLGGILGGGIHGIMYGGNGHGGGYGGGGEGNSVERAKYPAYNLLGKVWVSPANQLPREKHTIVVPLALQIMWGGSPLISNLSGRLDYIHELPLHSEITVTQSFADPNSDGDDAALSNKIKTTFDVKSIAGNTVAATLFDIPNGYAKDDTPVYFPQLALPVKPGPGSTAN